MNDLERDKIMASAEVLRQRETEPLSWEDPYSDMSSDEKSKLIIEQHRLLAARKTQSNSLMKKLDQSLSLQRTANEELRCVREMMAMPAGLIFRVKGCSLKVSFETLGILIRKCIKFH